MASRLAPNSARGRVGFSIVCYRWFSASLRPYTKRCTKPDICSASRDLSSHRVPRRRFCRRWRCFRQWRWRCWRMRWSLYRYAKCTSRTGSSGNDGLSRARWIAQQWRRRGSWRSWRGKRRQWRQRRPWWCWWWWWWWWQHINHTQWNLPCKYRRRWWRSRGNQQCSGGSIRW